MGKNLKKRNNNKKRNYNKNNFNKTRSHGDKIKGELDYFQPHFDNKLNELYTGESATDYREHLKDGVAQRMRDVLPRVLPINNRNIEYIDIIIRENVRNDYVNSFIGCSLRYYAGMIPHVAEVNRAARSNNKKDRYKSVKHAQQDCKECAKYYVKKAVMRFPRAEDVNIKNRLESSKRAIEIFADYIFNMHESNIPKQLDKPIFARLKDKYESICEFYTLDNQIDKYVANKNILYRQLDFLLATELFFSVIIE